MLRVVSCVAVVMLHVSARTIYLYDEVTPTIWNIANVISSSTRWCVPEFVMISGALLLRRAIDDPMRFIKRRFARIFVPIIFWSGVYLLWRAWNQPIALPYAAGELFRGTPYYHLYFLFVIAGLYAFTPAIAAAVQRLPHRQGIIYACTALIIAGITMTVQGLNGNAFTRFIPYIGYFVLGALLLEVRVPQWISATLFLCGVVSTAALTNWTASRAGIGGPWSMYFYSYFNPTVLVMAPALFCCVISMSMPAWLSKIVRDLAPATFGIFLIHPLILETLRNIYAQVAPILLWPPLDWPVTGLLTLLISGVLVVVMRRMPGVRRVV